ncbi:MAG: ABC transporter ATP-binding protein [Gemmatimonadales bacterium]|nr:ABC transporter ATP-binding protein [Gemmatimonadales bacterium]
MLRARGATVRYPEATADALADLDLEIGAGEFLAVAGPNGCGKTSLVRALLGLVPLTRGTVELEGRAIAGWRREDLAQVVGLLPQREEMAFSWRVEEVVGFGRYARLGALSPMSPADHAAVDRALERSDVASLRKRRVDTLSGGEWQRVRIARALAQEARLLVLDEPTAALDLGHEMELFELVQGLVGEGLAALVITHHLNVAARYAGRILLLDGGRVAASGSAGEVLRPELLSSVFRWPVSVITLDGAPQIIPRAPGATRRDYS